MNEGIPLPVAEETRRCTECREVLPIESFALSGRKGRRWDCKKCRKIRRAREPRRIKTPQERRRDRLREKFGITVEQYDRMLAAQDGACAICGKPPTRIALAVDHCHETGVVRALLCTTCNTMLGAYEWMRDRAPVYLAAYGEGNPVLHDA